MEAIQSRDSETLHWACLDRLLWPEGTLIFEIAPSEVHTVAHKALKERKASVSRGSLFRRVPWEFEVCLVNSLLAYVGATLIAPWPLSSSLVKAKICNACQQSCEQILK